MITAALTCATPLLCSPPQILHSPGSIERNADNAPETDCNGFAIDPRQCAEPLRVSGSYCSNLRWADDRWSREARTIEIRYAYIVRPAPVLGAGDHDQPQKAMRHLDLSGGDDEGGTALSNRPVCIWERDLDDVPNVKDRHTRAGRPRTTIHGT